MERNSLESLSDDACRTGSSTAKMLINPRDEEMGADFKFPRNILVPWELITALSPLEAYWFSLQLALYEYHENTISTSQGLLHTRGV